MVKLVTKYWFPIVAFALILLRFLHFDEQIDDPHSWRQYDTKQYIDGYYLDNNPFLEPSVCWMGNHETLVLEFPLPEYLIAKCYAVFGNHVWVGRLFFLLFFALSAYFVFKTLQLIFENWVPEIATICYMIAPLSLFYSRAIHIDFFALSFAFGMLYFAMKAIRFKQFKFLIIALVFASIAFLEKAPYTFYLALPIIVFAFQEKQLKWFLIRSGIFILPIILLLLWSNYSFNTNSKIPNWDQIPNFNRFTNMWYWYFGNWEQRYHFEFWKIVAHRLYYEILGYVGFIFATIGFIFYTKSKAYWWLVSLLGGTIIYWVLFFNLNHMHNYYQLPFVFPLVVIMAMGIQVFINQFKEAKVAKIVTASVLVLFALQSMKFAESNYYTIDANFEKVASLIKENTVDGDVIIVSYGGLTPQCPIILQPASRKGFSIPFQDLSPALIHSLYKEAGVRKLAIVYDGYFSGEFQSFFEAMDEKKGFDVDSNGKALYICTLKFMEDSIQNK